uniref:Uncharacterized protein n=1 Tax=Lepeophtheirus salmonis TaxID=72036 RepID=A0A0K2TG92_LEPSM
MKRTEKYEMTRPFVMMTFQRWCSCLMNFLHDWGSPTSNDACIELFNIMNIYIYIYMYANVDIISYDIKSSLSCFNEVDIYVNR